MKPTRSVLALPFHDWRKAQREGVRTRDGHVIRQLARNPRIGPVLVVDRPVSRIERWLTRQPPAVTGEIVAEAAGRGWRAILTIPEPGLTILDVAVGDVAGVVLDRRGWWFDIFSDRRAHEAVRWAMDRLGMDASTMSAIAWTPTVGGLIDRIRPERVIFDSLDNWLIHPVLRRHAERATRMYARLLPLADLVTVSGPASAAVLARFGVVAAVVPNGVDPERFARDSPRPSDLPAGQIVGYAGKLAERIDIDLVRTVARALPGLEFAFIGPVLDRRVRDLRREPNVRLLGDRSPDDLPAYIASFDVAWIPHRVGEGETGGDPIKLYEYWAAGRQVVTTRIDGAAGWEDRAFVVDGASDAINAIEAVVEGAARLPIWIEPERRWSAIADRFADALVGHA